MVTESILTRFVGSIVSSIIELLTHKHCQKKIDDGENWWSFTLPPQRGSGDVSFS